MRSPWRFRCPWPFTSTFTINRGKITTLPYFRAGRRCWLWKALPKRPQIAMLPWNWLYNMRIQTPKFVDSRRAPSLERPHSSWRWKRRNQLCQVWFLMFHLLRFILFLLWRYSNFFRFMFQMMVLFINWAFFSKRRVSLFRILWLIWRVAGLLREGNMFILFTFVWLQ